VKDFFADEYSYLSFALRDTEGQAIAPVFEKCHAFIDTARAEGASVLVHCNAGISRSATIVISYLMHREKMSLREALAWVKARRKVISPNFGFVRQLIEYEKRLGRQASLTIEDYTMAKLIEWGFPQEAVRSAMKRGGGSIVTLSYLGSDRVFPNYNVMGVAKAALESSVRYLAADLGPKNIRVNAVSAGPIKTLSAMGISGFSSILNVYRERAPLRRTVETSEVGEAAAFLLSDAGRGITGEVLVVDGGYHAMGL